MTAYTDESAAWADLQNNEFDYLANDRTKTRRNAAIGDEIIELRGNYNDASSRVAALEALANGGAFFTLKAGAVTVAATEPNASFVELEYPGGVTLAKNDYTELYTEIASQLTEWNAVSSGVSSAIYGVAYNDSRIIAVGQNIGILSTDDGDNWLNASVQPAGTCKSIAANGLTGASAKLVAVGDADYIGLTTGATAGDTWSTQTSPVLDSNHNWSQVKYFAGAVNKFVAIGYKETATDVYSTKIASSADGVTWAVEKTIAGRFEDIAYNDNYGSSDEFVIVGWPGLGGADVAQKASTLSGTWTTVTFAGAATVYLNSVEYYDDGTGRGFATCGLVGKAGIKSIGASDFSAAVDVVDTPYLTKVVADDTNQVFYALGQPVEGVAYIYEASVTDAGVEWTPDAVGGFSINDYAIAGSDRVTVGNGGSVYKYSAASDSDFTVPYPATVAYSSPFKPYLLTKGIGGSQPGGGLPPGGGDLANLETNWSYVQVKSTSTQYIRGFATNSSGTIVCYGDGGLLYKSTDYGLTWTDIGTALGLTGDIFAGEFGSDDKLSLADTEGYRQVAADLLSLNIDSDVVGLYDVFYTSSGGYFWLRSPITYTPGFKIGISALGSSGADLIWTVSIGGFPDSDVSALFASGVISLSGKELYILNLENGNAYLLNNTEAPLSGSNEDLEIVETFENQVIKRQSYSESFGEIMLCGKNGTARVIDSDLSSSSTALTLDNSFDIEDAAQGAGAWVLFTRRGIHVSTDSSTADFYGGVVAATAGHFVSSPGRIRFIANDLEYPGYIKVCIL